MNYFIHRCTETQAPHSRSCTRSQTPHCPIQVWNVSPRCGTVTALRCAHSADNTAIVSCLVDTQPKVRTGAQSIDTTSQVSMKAQSERHTGTKHSPLTPLGYIRFDARHTQCLGVAASMLRGGHCPPPDLGGLLAGACCPPSRQKPPAYPLLSPLQTSFS